MNSDEFSTFQFPLILYLRNLGDEMPRNDVNKLLKDFHLSSCSRILSVLVLIFLLRWKYNIARHQDIEV